MNDNIRSNPQTQHAIHRAVRRFALCEFASLGYLPTYLGPQARAESLRRFAGRDCEPIYIDIPYRTTVRMGRVLGKMAREVQIFRKRSNRRRLVFVSASVAVAVYRYLELGGTVVEGSAEAILSAVRYVNEDVVCSPRPDMERVAEFMPAALAALSNEDHNCGTYELAAALRKMYGLRTMKEQLAAQMGL